MYGNFCFECLEIKETQDKISGIEEKRTLAFRLLLNGSPPLVKKLDKILKEYEDEKTGTPESQESPITEK